MATDRFLKIVLTIIALELGWIAVSRTATPVAAQAAPTRVVIAGVEFGANAVLPVAVVGSYRGISAARGVPFEPLTVSVDSTRPILVSSAAPLNVQVVAPVRIDTERPLKVESVAYTPALRPGE